MLSIQVVCMPGLRGLSRKLTGLATLPSLAHNKCTCPWSSLFKSSQVPRASLFASASGRVVCEDALQEVQKQDAAQTFPWTSSTWPDCLHNAILKQVVGSLTADELVRKPVVLIHVQTSSERPLGFTELLAMWIAMYVPKNALCCYTSPDGEQVGFYASVMQGLFTYVHDTGSRDVQLRRCGHLLFLDQKALIAAQDAREGDNCCMLLSPVHRHLLMVVDLQDLGANSPAWSIPDRTLHSAVHDLGTLMFKRLHTTRALIMMSLCKDEDAELRSTFDEAVQLLYSSEPQGPQVQVAQGIEPVMYCFVPYSSPSTPAAVKHFLEDAVSRFSEPEDVCVILSVSVPNMTVSELTCQQVPELDYVCGVVESHFQRDLAVHHLVRRRPLFS